MTDIVTIMLAGFATGVTTVLFGFGGGFVVVPFVYQILARQEAVAENAMHIAVATSTAVMVFNASWASYQNWRAGKLIAETIFPLALFISAGAVLGSLLAGFIHDATIRLLFSAYLLVTLADCLLRRGFLQRSQRRTLSAATSTAGGLLIGGIAALLGVGGSVMTVPLLRRHGFEMRHCVSAANPLSIPVALFGSAGYLFSGLHVLPGSDYMGYINLKILALLTTAGFLGILFTRRFIPPVPDILHARIYVALLFSVLVAIAI